MHSLPYQVIAFDMDGTFLSDHKDFDKVLFEQVLQTVTNQNGHLVVASGDPLDCLLRYFSTEELAQLTIVAENGAQIYDHGQETLVQSLDPKVAQQAIDYLVHQMGIHPVISGHQQGYFPKDLEPAAVDHLSFYYPKYQLVDSFDVLPDDQFFQLSFLISDDQVSAAVEKLSKQFGDKLIVTPSGNGSMDLTQPGINKGWALWHLLDQWQLSPNQLVAFGDGGNDVPMLELAGRSFAMPNAGQQARNVATDQALADNNHDGVLKTIKALLEGKI